MINAILINRLLKYVLCLAVFLPQQILLANPIDRQTAGAAAEAIAVESAPPENFQTPVVEINQFEFPLHTDGGNIDVKVLSGEGHRANSKYFEAAAQEVLTAAQNEQAEVEVNLFFGGEDLDSAHRLLEVARGLKISEQAKLISIPTPRLDESQRLTTAHALFTEDIPLRLTMVAIRFVINGSIRFYLAVSAGIPTAVAMTSALTVAMISGVGFQFFNPKLLDWLTHKGWNPFALNPDKKIEIWSREGLIKYWILESPLFLVPVTIASALTYQAIGLPLPDDLNAKGLLVGASIVAAGTIAFQGVLDYTNATVRNDFYEKIPNYRENLLEWTPEHHREERQLTAAERKQVDDVRKKYRSADERKRRMSFVADVMATVISIVSVAIAVPIAADSHSLLDTIKSTVIFGSLGTPGIAYLIYRNKIKATGVKGPVGLPFFKAFDRNRNNLNVNLADFSVYARENVPLSPLQYGTCRAALDI